MNFDRKSVVHREHLLSSVSDCTFLVGQGEEKKQFKALESLLAASSPVFEAMFFGEQAKTENKTESEVIEIPDVSPAAFQILLYHAYFLPDLENSMNWPSTKIVLEIFYAGHKYMISGLEDEGEKYLKGNISAETIFVILHAARLYELKELEDACLKFFKDNTTKCLYAYQLHQASLDELQSLFSSTDMDISSELELLLALERYIKANGLSRNKENHQSVKIGDVLKEIRPLTLEFKDFDRLTKLTVLTADEKLAIGAHLSCPTSTQPLPSTINSNRGIRGISRQYQYWIEHIKMFFQKHGSNQLRIMCPLGCGYKTKYYASTILLNCPCQKNSMTELNGVFDKSGIQKNIRNAVESDSKELKLALCNYFKNQGIDVYKVFKL